MRLSIQAHGNEITTVAISPDGRFVASGGLKGLVKIWNIATGENLYVLAGNQEISDLAFSPDGEKVICAARNDAKKDVLQIWEYEKEKLLAEIEGHNQRINTVAYSPDGKMIATGSGDNTVKTWYANNGRDIQSYPAGKNDVLAVSWSPDNRYIAAGLSWDGTILVWDAARDNLTKTLSGHSDWVNAVRYTPDGRHIISGSLDGSVRSWDTETGSQEIISHKSWLGGILSLAISVNGAYLAAGTENSTVAIWDTESGKLLDYYEGHTGRVNQVAYSRDGKTIVSGGVDGTVKIWAAPAAGDPEALFNLAAKHQNGNDRIEKDSSAAFKWYLKSAEAGFPAAMTMIGTMSAAGIGTTKNLQSAVKWLTAAADINQPEALYALGNMYATGTGVPADQEKAATLWAKAAKNGHVEAGRQLKMQTGDIEIDKLTKDTLFWLIKAGEDGNIEAMYNLGIVFKNGSNDISPDQTLSINWLTKAAKNGHVNAYDTLGDMYAAGLGVTADQNKAASLWAEAAGRGLTKSGLKLSKMLNSLPINSFNKNNLGWLKAAATAGDVKAMHTLAVIFMEGKNDIAGNISESFGWFMKAGQKGHPEAQYNLGKLYSLGLGTGRSAADSLEWYLKAAEQGHVEAQYQVGLIYADGNGLGEDYLEAAGWLKKAAAKGHIAAKYRLGIFYCTGLGLERNYAKALVLWQEAAKSGDSMSSLFLGYMYETGTGVKHDLAKATKYYKDAASHGYSFFDPITPP